ncbi:hypothetical protein ABEB36_009333 [Hypothenemus hampei]|uniref:Uncharacterized protein n=1 Tax=Hypothenemus hampei TaxID=57062 RepID=A0ABD1EG07_HYPHA
MLDIYNGPWRTSIIRKLTPVYLQAVPNSSAKLKHIKDLLAYLRNVENRRFYEKMDEDDNSNGCEV